MPLAVLSVYVVLLLLQTADGADTDSLYVRIIDGKTEYRNQSSVIRAFKAGSPIECGVECNKVTRCVSFNLKTEPDNSYVCVLFDSIPLSPTRDLMLAKDTEYYEKSCQPTVRVADTTALISSMLALYVFGDMGTSMYLLQFKPNFDQDSFRYQGTTAAITSDEHQILTGAEELYTVSYLTTTIVVSEGRLFCQHYTLTDSQPCFTTDSVPLKDIFNTQDVSAVMSDAFGHVIYGFTQDQVIKVNTPANGPWTVDSVIDLPGVPGSQFQHFPRGIRGATYMRNWNTTALFTMFYYMILDGANNVIKRSQVCL
ncbi:uncharacterized protein LOC124255429 [Haliotis rubra]|uniref:uncharacterized protein LOC124255429 n=1 Tax=Haliotis rubra TaxID=36100 RepID=UPI001EE4EB8E|nr:uncharacterized protein LOC124255429 [Haliotis rubra]